MTPPHPLPSDAAVDPVRARRARVARWTRLANRVGYLVLLVAVALFLVAIVAGFSGTVAGLIVTAMIISFVLLAPSIVVGYAVKAAEREDLERGW
ncbi:MAG: hypothetical protein HKN41_07230 [Ilumatobacter sp.]|nr:hypothetical protein [Ilumatobacter sp.]